FDGVCDLDASARDAYIDSLAGKEPDLAKELVSLLRYDRREPDTMDRASAGVAAFVRAAVPLSTEPSEAGDPPSAPLPGGGADVELLGVLGEGGMGRVLLARQRS